MAKSLTIVLLICLCSCNRSRFDEREYHVLFLYNPWVIVDFNTQTVEVNMGKEKYVSNLNLSTTERSRMIKSFEDNKIGDIKGDVIYPENVVLTMPPSVFTIKIMTNQIIKADIKIAYNYNDKGRVLYSQQYRVVNFRNEILDVLKKNLQFKKAIDTLAKYQTRLWKHYMNRIN